MFCIRIFCPLWVLYISFPEPRKVSFVGLRVGQAKETLMCICSRWHNIDVKEEMWNLDPFFYIHWNIRKDDSGLVRFKFLLLDLQWKKALNLTCDTWSVQYAHAVAAVHHGLMCWSIKIKINKVSRQQMEAESVFAFCVMNDFKLESQNVLAPAMRPISHPAERGGDYHLLSDEHAVIFFFKARLPRASLLFLI